MMRLYFFMFLIILSGSVFAQSEEKIIDKIDFLIDVGEYKKADNSIQKFKEKAEKKYGNPSKFLAIGLLKDAHNKIGLGLLKEVDTLLEKSVEMTLASQDAAAKDQGYILENATDIMILYGNYVKASKLHRQAISVFTKANLLDEDQSAILDVLQARIWTGIGYYSKSIQLIEGKLDYYLKRISAVSGKKEVKSRKKEYAYMLLMKANSLRLMGDYQSADSAFVYTTQWIDDNLSKATLIYSWSQFLNAQLLEENGLDEDALVKFYQKAYNNSLRKNSAAHYINVLIQESIIKAYYRNDKKDRLKSATELFRNTINKNFDKTSVNKIILKTIKYDFKLDNNKIKDLEAEINKLLVSTDELPTYHQRRIDLLEFAKKIATLNNQHKNTEIYLNRILAIQKVLYGENSPVYHLTNVKLANFYTDYTEKLDEARNIYKVSYEGIVSNEIVEGHVDYVDILNHTARFYEETDNYKKASKTLEDALRASRRKYDDKDIEYAIELEKIAALQIKIGMYDQADKNLKTTLKVLDDIKTPIATAHKANTLITIAKLQAIKGEYDEAGFSIYKSDKLKRKTELPAIYTSNDSKVDRAELYLNLGKYGSASEILKKELKSKRYSHGNKSRYITRSLTLLAKLNLTTGDYSKAERLCREAYNINLEIFGNQSSKITPALTVLAEIYSTIGDYDKAEESLNQAIAIQKEQFGKGHVDLGKLYGRLALVKFYNQHKYETVEKLFLDSERIIGKKLGGSSPAYAETLKNLAIINITNKQFSLAKNYLNTAGKIWSEKIGRRNNINAATINLLKGDIEYSQKNYDDAIGFYHGAQKVYEKLFNKSHPEYIKVLSKLSKTHYMMGEKRKSKEYINTVLANYQGFIKDFFPTLSEREKAKFWNTIKTDYEFYYTLAISDIRKNPSLAGDLYNKTLLSKALLLNSSRKTRKNILNSGDDELKSTFSDWIEKKELLTFALSMTSDELNQNEINTADLANEIELLEKSLNQKSVRFSKALDNKVIQWKDIQKSLDENEIALEMTRFRHFDHNFTDSIVYAVFYLKQKSGSQPELILMGNGKELEKRYLKYYRNSIKFKIHDKYSYKKFWKPIEDRIDNLSKIYLSPDGVYNQINIEAIPIEKGKYVLDNSNIVLVNNTKEILLNKYKSSTSERAKIATIFGDPQFYVATEPGKPTRESGISREKAEIISKLPGTRGEVKGLESLLNEKGWKTDEYLSSEATEERIKKVNSPRVMHIATHGFFQADAKKTARLDEANYLYDNPLLRSGLLLTGAGDIFNKTKFNYNVDNGILTAYEAMNLNLDQTDLVILSACETGLGEVESGEGVYGLQRSFLVAGAKSVIMSLFKVSDEATKELMVSFYEKWMSTGDKRGSFIQAKKEIRNKYKDPIYWGPFVMIGMDN